jgi:hypothetical protein
MWKWITYFLLGLVLIIILNYLLYRALWKNLNWNPLRATHFVLVLVGLLTFCWFTLLFVRIINPLYYAGLSVLLVFVIVLLFRHFGK